MRRPTIQAKANRPSGKPAFFITLVGKANNYNWDLFIWILYNPRYEICEAWEWTVERCRAEVGSLSHVPGTHAKWLLSWSTLAEEKFLI